MTADEWQKQFEELWKQVFDPDKSDVRIHHTNFGRRQILVNHTGPVELKPEIKDENGHTIYETEYLKDNEWGFKDFIPYRTESHRVWRKTEKGWDLYTIHQCIRLTVIMANNTQYIKKHQKNF